MMIVINILICIYNFLARIAEIILNFEVGVGKNEINHKHLQIYLQIFL